jgi:hypothetical protein
MIVEGILGVVSGLLGNAVTTFFNYKQQKLKNQHELNMVEAETKAMIAETEANIRVSEIELAQDMERADADIYQESQKQGHKTALESSLLEKLFESGWTKPFGVLLAFLLGLVDFLKHFMRPGLTAYFVVLSTWLTWQAIQIIQAKQDLIPIEMATQIFQDNMNVIFYLTVSAFTWWFGDRRVAKFLYRLNDGNLRN